jgi:polyisoprenoid-binding protein YceI
MNITTYTGRLLTLSLELLLLVGIVGFLGAIRGEAAAPSNLSATPAASHSSPTGATSTGHGIRLTVSSGTSAGYRAREQSFFGEATDVVGTTTAVTGSIVLNARGRIVPAQSTFIIDLRTLKSDQPENDQFIQENTLQTAQYPEAVFRVERVVGLPPVLPTSGTIHGSLVGNLTLHGVTRSTTWTGTATLDRRTVTVVATTPVTLTSFNISPPQMGPVSVDDAITLEINVRLTRTPLS